MHIYLLRHAIAVPRGAGEYPNDDRPLTDDGVKKMFVAARGLARIVGKVDTILTSPLVRARDTAKIAAQAMSLEERIQVCDALLPTAPQSHIMEYLASLRGVSRVMLVGHEPALGFLASAFMWTDESTVEFKKGGACRIHVASIPPERPGKLLWLLTPRQLRALSE